MSASEHVLPREQPAGAADAGRNLAHIFCHTCHGYPPGAVVYTPVRSLCAQFHAPPRHGLRKRLLLCVVCADICDTGQCPTGHPLVPLEQILREMGGAP